MKSAYTPFLGRVQWHRAALADWSQIYFNKAGRASFMYQMQRTARKSGLQLAWLKPRKVVEPDGSIWVYWKAKQTS